MIDDRLSNSKNLFHRARNVGCILAGSTFEIELRMATVLAGWLLKNEINDVRLKREDFLITSQELDHLLWSRGRQIGNENKHHLTITTMY